MKGGELCDADSILLLKGYLNERSIDYHHLTTYNHEIRKLLEILFLKLQKKKNKTSEHCQMLQ